jgi:hypothetical protein
MCEKNEIVFERVTKLHEDADRPHTATPARRAAREHPLQLLPDEDHVEGAISEIAAAVPRKLEMDS